LDYIDLAVALKAETRWVLLHPSGYQRLIYHSRCLLFEGGIELAWHNNLYRAFCLTDSVKVNEVSPCRPSLLQGLTFTNKEPREMLEYPAFTSYRSSYQAPSKDEGFKDIKRFYWKFDGTDAEKERYMRWLEV
jgi:bifunctional polynucleotide phosphatase/kinase